MVRKASPTPRSTRSSTTSRDAKRSIGHQPPPQPQLPPDGSPPPAQATAAPVAPAAAPASHPYHLTTAREAALLVEAESLGDNLLLFPGKLARRVAWSGRIQLAAERDAADLVRTPFPDDEPPITHDEIRGQRDKIELLRVTQSRWQAAQQTQRKAVVNFEKPAAEAGQHKVTLLRFFDVRFKNNTEGQKRLSAIREGSGDADLVQDVSDLLVLAADHVDAINKAPRGEAEALRRLKELSPQLLRLLADKTLSPEQQRARKLRDAAYTLVMNTERRFRTAAEYWYGGTDKAKDYAIFPASASTAAAPSAEDDAEPGDAPEAPPATGGDGDGDGTPPV